MAETKEVLDAEKSRGATEVGAAESKGKGTLIFIGIGLLATLLLGGLKVLFERSSFGHRAEVFAFELLQGQLPYFDPDNPVVVLDTSDIGRESVNSRTKLEEIIPALVKLSPLAIGVDWDFAPGETSYSSPEDPRLFEICLDETRRHGVPIFLGVGKKRKAAPPNAWLGGPQYKELAAAVGADEEDATRLPVMTQKKGESEGLPLLGYALAKAYHEKLKSELPRPPSWIRWAVAEGEHDSRGSAFVYEERLVNYSNLEAMRLAAQRDLSADSVAESGRKSYEGKIVILGDSSAGFSDAFGVPGVKGKVGGVLMHASAAYTFAVAPLFEFKWWMRLLLDFLLAFGIVAGVAFLRHRHAGEPDFSLRRQQKKFVWAAMLLAVVAGWLLVYYTRVMWLDFLLVLAALFLHPKLEGRIHDFQERRKRAAASGGAESREEAFVSEPDASATPTAARAGVKASAGVKAVVCVLAAVLIQSATARAQEASQQCVENAPAAVVVGVKRPESKKRKRQPPVTCRFRDSVKQDWVGLSDNDNAKRRLAAGHQLCCDEGCVLTIFFCGTRKEFDVQNACRQDDKTAWWYTVLEAYQTVPYDDKYKNDAARPGENELVFVPTNPDVPTASEARITAADNYSRDRGWESYEPRVQPKRGGKEPASSERSAKEAKLDRAEEAAIDKNKEAVLDRSSRERATPAEDRRMSRDPASVEWSGNILNDREAARDYLKRAEELNNRYSALLRLANASRDGKEYAAAAQQYTEALTLVSGDARALYGLGNVYADQQKWDEALKFYRAAVAESPYSQPVLLALAYALLQPHRGSEGKADMDEAEKSLLYVILLTPSNKTAYALYDMALHRRGAGPAEAEAAYARLVTVAHSSVEAHTRLSDALWANGKEAEADERLRLADALAHTAQEFRGVAQTFEMRGGYEEAESALRRALALDPKDAPSLFMLGRVRLLRKNYGGAAWPLKRAAELSPKWFSPRFLLGLTYLNAGALPQAEQAFDDAAVVAASDHRQLLAATFELGRVGDAHAKAGRLSEAVRVYEHVLRFDPEDEATAQKLAESRAAGRR